MKTRTREMLLRYNKERQRNILAKAGVHDFVIVLDSLKPGFNIPKVFRSAGAFGAREVHLVDIGPFDPAPAKGSFRKVPARFHENFRQCWEQLRDQGYEVFVLDPRGETSLPESSLPVKCAFVFGHEEWGFSFELADYPAIRRLAIPQFGEVQSLNVSVAASIVMYEYLRQHGQRR